MKLPLAVVDGLVKDGTQGTQTKGNFVPEQHTDYIFSTVGEEWGFIGSLGVVILFIFLIIRVLVLAEQQKSQFARIYGYSVGAILFFSLFYKCGDGYWIISYRRDSATFL